ncbi:MAG: TIR domain-containing protein [Pirellulaceae bacterium]
MNILLGWSKERSCLMAKALRAWLPKVIPVSPWMSEVDIDKGKDWSDELHAFLGQASAVIVCVTPENVRSPWLYYECGRVSAKLEATLICPYLLENDHSILADGPLARLQQTKANKSETFQLLESLRKTGNLESESHLSTAFEREWWELGETLKRIRNIEESYSARDSSIQTLINELAGGELVSAERQMLLAIGKSNDGLLIEVTTSHGHDFITGGLNLNPEDTARTTAMWREARRSLVRRQLLEMRGRKGESFALTDKGFQVFDALMKNE